MNSLWRRWSIRSWLAGLASAIAVPLIVLVTGLFYIETQHEEARARETAHDVARGIAARLRSLNDESSALLDRIAGRPKIRNFNGECDSFFNVVEYIPRYVNLFFYDANGALLCSGVPTHSDEATNDLVRKLIADELRAGHLQAHRPMMLAVANRWVVVLPVPVTHPDGTPAGLLALVESPEVLGMEALPPTSNIGVFDGSMLVESNSQQPQVWSNQTFRGSPLTRIDVVAREGETEMSGGDNVPRQYGFTNVAGMGWRVYVGIPTDDVIRHVRRFLWRGLPAGIALALGIGAMAAFLARRIQKPINALAHAAGAIGSGAHETVGVEGPSEIASLASTFNSMVENRSETDARIRESERNLKALSERLLAIEEEERRRIARELHDDLGQSLTGLKMDVIGLLNSTPPSASNAALRGRIVQTLDATVTAVQRIASELRPQMLDDLGLAVAIESEARLFEERTGIECDLSIPAEDELRISQACAVAMYRIVQEALTNVSRHADATRVELRIRRRGDELLLEIRDDGRGASQESIRRPASLGILGMRERAAVLGGVVHVEGVDGRGTIVSVRIPAPRSAE
jgi:signal transduction histidine kinase